MMYGEAAQEDRWPITPILTPVTGKDTPQSPLRRPDRHQCQAVSHSFPDRGAVPEVVDNRYQATVIKLDARRRRQARPRRAASC